MGYYWRELLPTKKKKHLYTIGHSTRSLKEFLDILTAYGINLLVDIRHFPGSRKFPHFGQKRLQAALKRRSIKYLHLESLGGRRRPDPESELNQGWRNVNFRGYADYMRTKEFREGLKELMEKAKSQKTVIMCAEAVPWRCHRSLVGDVLLVKGFEVEDIFSSTSVRPHKLTPFAQVHRGRVTYPAEE